MLDSIQFIFKLKSLFTLNKQPRTYAFMKAKRESFEISYTAASIEQSRFFRLPEKTSKRK